MHLCNVDTHLLITSFVTFFRECPLTLAAEKGYSDLAELLLSRNANVETRTKKGCSPFFLACKEGFTAIAITLANHGASIEVSLH